MNDFRIRMLAENFVRRNDSFGSAVTLADFLRDLIQNESVTLNEPKFTYEFGGVSLKLTETQIATATAYVEEGKKIQGIKYLREITGIGLREGKDFCYGLEAFQVRVRQIRDKFYSE